MAGSTRERVVVLTVAVVTVVLLGPALAPGYTLLGDQVFVPDPSLLPWMLGLGAGLPRSVPQDAVIALLTGPVPGWVWEKFALVAALALLGLGVARLLRGQGARAAIVGAVVAMWSPYVGERLLIGHWSLLLALAVLPWALVHADGARLGSTGALARWVLVVALASLTVTGGLLLVLVTAPVLLWPGGLSRRLRLLGLAAALALQLPWAVPALVHPGSSTTGGADVFALRPEGLGGALLSALGTGGLWNADSVPGSRSTLLAPMVTLSLLGLAWAGRRRTAQALGSPVTTMLVVASVVGLAVALCGAWSVTSGLTRWWVENAPGGGLLRDGQKWLAPWLLLLAVSSALGSARLSRAAARRTGDAAVGMLLVVAAVALPVLGTPDLVWGATGRLATVQYPPDWADARRVLATDPSPGDVISLPWSAYRRFGWNLDRPVLDPAPRAMPRTVVVSDALVVRRGDALVVIPGDDPRAAAIGAAVAGGSGADLAATLRVQGIGWALVAQSGTPVILPAGATRVMSGPDLELYRLTAPAPAPVVSGVAAVLAADAVALSVVVSAAVILLVLRRRRRTRTE